MSKNSYVYNICALWEKSDAITSLTFTGEFPVGATFYLYGSN